MPDSQAKTAWKNANTTRIVMNLNHRTDADILYKLSQVNSKQGYIKSLIRSDMETEDDIESHRLAVEEYQRGETVRHEDIDWD